MMSFEERHFSDATPRADDYLMSLRRYFICHAEPY
jgi:hypothetical protein